MHTIAGDCGAPFLCIDNRRERKVFGFHMLGNEYGSGTSVVITKEVFREMEIAGQFRADLEIPIQEFQGVPDPMIDIPVDVIPTPFEPTKTKFRRSEIFGMVTEPTTTPSVTRKTDDFDPMERGITELQKPKYWVDHRFLEKAKAVTSVRLCEGEPTIARTLTIEEACSGEGIIGMEPIERSTSAGLPLCMEPDANGKKKWIDEDHRPTPTLVEMTEKFEQEVFDGYLEKPPVFKDSLKDERVKLEKADKSQPEKIKTRLFAACPLVFLVSLRKYFGAYYAHATRNSITNSQTGGMNPFGADWERLAQWLFEVNKNVDDGDYKCYDTTQPSGFLEVVFDTIRLWYNVNGGNSKDDLIRSRLAELCYHAFHSMRGTVFRVQGTLPSGMYGTTPINSGVNLVTFYYAFDQIYPNATPQEFLDNVRTATHGDDVVFSVSPKYPDFTSENIGIALVDIGMTFTPALKNGTATIARPIEEVTFLKRSFRKVRGLYRAPLARESSLEMCNWITKTNDRRTATIDNCRAAMRELALSEPDTTLQQRIQAAVYERTHELLPIITEEELCNEFTKFY